MIAIVVGATATACASPADGNDLADPNGDRPGVSTDGSASSSPTGSGVTAPDAPTDAPEQVVPQQLPTTPIEDGPSGLDLALGLPVEGLPEPAVPLTELRSGGPPPDGIPAVDAPQFLRPADVDFLADNEPVLVVEIDGDARAYPVQVLIWHEIVNDTVGGVPVAVTYCPLCNSAIAYDRRIGDRVVSFGTSGMLWNSALVMYDRQTETIWSHFNGQALAGVLTGTDLATFPVATVPWRTWADAHPDGLVLSRDTGFERSYGRNPYPGYDDVGSQPFLFEGAVDGRYTAMTRIVGFEVGDAAVGVPLVELREVPVISVDVEGETFTVWWAGGTTSALDASDIVDGSDIGATGVFVPMVDGTALTFTAAADGAGFVDDQTGSTWNILGQAVDGPLTGAQLERLAHVDTFWFAWSTFRPDTRVVTAS